MDIVFVIYGINTFEMLKTRIFQFTLDKFQIGRKKTRTCRVYIRAYQDFLKIRNS